MGAARRLVLASRSPRRRELLERLGVPCVCEPADIPEQPAPGEDAAAYVRRVARGKARAVLARHGGEAGTFVLGADTDVVLDGEVLGKPADAAAATLMLQRLSGRTHQVLCALCLLGPAHEDAALVITDVRFAPLDAATIRAYVATGEPFGKAGAYAIQGRGGALVAHLAGSPSAVMGLPLHETALALRRAGFGAVHA